MAARIAPLVVLCAWAGSAFGEVGMPGAAGQVPEDGTAIVGAGPVSAVALDVVYLLWAEMMW